MGLHDVARDVHAEPGAAMAPDVGGVHLAELFEDLVGGVLGDADAVILHGKADLVVMGVEADLDPAAGFGELGGVGEHVDQHLFEAMAVGVDPVFALGRLHVQGHVEARGIGPGAVDRGGGHGAELDRFDVKLELAGLGALQVEQVVDEVGEAFAVAAGHVEEVLHLRRHGAERARVDQLERALDGGQRRAQLVADGGEEFLLGVVGGLGLFMLGDQRVDVAQVLDVADEEVPAAFDDEGQHEEHGEELEPERRGQLGLYGHEVADRDVEQRDEVDRQPYHQRRQDLVVVDAGEDRCREQHEERQEVHRMPLLGGKRDREEGNDRGAEQRADIDHPHEMPGLGPVAIAPAQDLVEHVPVERLAQPDHGVEKQRCRSVVIIPG